MNILNIFWIFPIAYILGFATCSLLVASSEESYINEEKTYKKQNQDKMITDDIKHKTDDNTVCCSCSTTQSNESM